MHASEINKKRAACWAPPACKGQDPEAKSMELGRCAVYLGDTCTPSVLLQSGIDVNDFLLSGLVERRSRDSVPHKFYTRTYCKSEGAGFV